MICSFGSYLLWVVWVFGAGDLTLWFSFIGVHFDCTFFCFGHFIGMWRNFGFAGFSSYFPSTFSVFQSLCFVFLVWLLVLLGIFGINIESLDEVLILLILPLRHYGLGSPCQRPTGEEEEEYPQDKQRKEQDIDCVSRDNGKK